ncbi:mRNA capping enzyme family protein [Zea mays]|uniref:mRNA capping enzyme family protein n=1 Tax=Zea mays TaxID=4577 RepID=A0A1D6PRX6_MAIZE|nr:mRNA capping enzyme family protein [Zea mays]
MYSFEMVLMLGILLSKMITSAILKVSVKTALFFCSLLSILVLLVVMRSITDNITEEKLLEEIDEISLLPMYADRMQQAHTKMAQQQRRRLPPQC